MDQITASVGKVPEKFSRKRLPKIPLIIVALIVGSFGAFHLLSSHASTGCDQTVSSVTSAQSAVSSAAAGSTICMSPGSYGSITLSGSHSGNVTFEADPTQDPNGSGKVTFSGINVSGSYITVHNFYTTAGLNFLYPATHDVANHNDVTNSPGGYGIDISCNTAPSQPGCSYITINGNRIHDLSSTSGDGDGLRLDGWSNVTITANEEYHIEQLSGTNEGHTDCLQSYNANVSTHDVVFDHNYEHDNQCQGFFLKDGDVSHNVTVTDNLLVRGANKGGADTNIFLVENTDNAIIRNNTTVDTGGSVLEADGSGAANATVDHNVFDVFNNGSPNYALTENHNIFTDGNEWSFTPNSTDTPTSYGVKVTPTYKCGSICGNGTVAGDDYELASNPNGIGIDWAPSQYTYGPVNTSGGGTPAADTTSPTVSISGPSNNSTVSGSTTVSANASDNVGVASVQFKLDGNDLGSADTASPYSTTWDTTGVSNGSHTLTAVAKDAAGNTATSSSVTVTVSNSTASGSGSGGVTKSSDCFSDPSACGYPDATNTGVPAGTTLTPSGSITASTAGEVINAKDVTGNIEIDANNVTVENTRVTLNSGSCGPTTSCGNSEIRINEGVTGTVIKDSELRTASGITCEHDIRNTSSGTVQIIGDYLHGCDSNLYNVGNATMTDTYGLSKIDISNDHVENIYFDDSTMTVEHSTLFNPVEQTAVVFGNSNGGSGDNNACKNHLTVDNSLFAGGGFTLYPCAHASTAGSSNTSVTNTHFARCVTTPVYHSNGGNTTCQGGPDSNGYYPGSGNYGVAAYFFSKATTWTGNTWDDNGQAICMDGSDGCGGSGGSDTTPPTVSIASPGSGTTVSGTVTSTVNASDNVGVTKVEISLDGSLKMTDTDSPYDYSFDSKTLSNGSHTLSAKAYDAAGNTKTATVTFTVSNADTTPPSAPSNLTAAAKDATTVGLSWTASTDSGSGATGVATYDVLRNGTVIGHATGTSYTDSKLTANTSYSYTVEAVDGAGNVSAASNTATVKTPNVSDTTPPSTPANLQADAVSQNQVDLSWNASTDTGGSGLAGYNVYRNGTKINPSLVTTTSYGDSTVSASTAYSYTVEAVDGAGNKSPQTSAVSVTTPAPSDTTPPTVSVSAPADNATVSGVTTISANASDNKGVASVQFKLDGSALGARDTTSPYSISWDTTTVPNGTHTLTALATDTSGNTKTSSTVTVTVNNTSSTGGGTDKLLGTKHIQSLTDYNDAGSAEAFPYKATASGHAGTLAVYVDKGSAASKVIVGVYSNGAGKPDALLASGTINSPSAASWNTATLNAEPSITSGNTYWIAILGTGGRVKFRDASSNSCSQSSKSGNLTSLPASWSSGQIWPTCTASAYVNSASSGTGTTSAAAPAVQIQVTDSNQQPVSGVLVSVDGQTAKTDAGGYARFSSVAAGRQTVSFNYHGHHIAKRIQVKNAASGSAVESFNVSTTQKLNPLLIILPLAALVVSAMVVLHPWNGRLQFAAHGAADSDEQAIVSSNQPGQIHDQPIGHKIDAPGTTVTPTLKKDEDQSHSEEPHQ